MIQISFLESFRYFLIKRIYLKFEFLIKLLCSLSFKCNKNVIRKENDVKDEIMYGEREIEVGSLICFPNPNIDRDYDISIEFPAVSYTHLRAHET